MALWLPSDPLVLASRSSARKALLEAAGVPVEVRQADLDERSLEANAAAATAAAVAALLAREKASVIAGSYPGRLVLGADQTLQIDSERFAKPTDYASARVQLHALRGRTHELHSAIVFARDSTLLFEHVDTACLTMRSFSECFLDRYLEAAGSSAIASVGAYQIEGLGIQLFERIAGDYFTVLGLPLLAALDFLRRQGCLVP